jgi:hypothetical protein
MPKAFKRIRVYGQPKSEMDPDLLAQVLILLGRELHAKRVATAPPDSKPPDSEAEAAS